MIFNLIFEGFNDHQKQHMDTLKDRWCSFNFDRLHPDHALKELKELVDKLNIENSTQFSYIINPNMELIDKKLANIIMIFISTIKNGYGNKEGNKRINDHLFKNPKHLQDQDYKNSPY